MKVISEVEAVKKNRIGVGEGKNSNVWLADDPQLGGEIAIKEMPTSRFKNPSEYLTEAQKLYRVWNYAL